MDVLKAIESVALSKRITTKPNDMKTKRDDDDETYNNNAVKLVKTFIDEPYNRTGFTFAVRTDDDFDDAVNGGDNSALVVLDGKAKNERRKKKVSRLIANRVHEVATSAFMEIGSFKKHSATHPRLGIVDHVSVHPIGTCDMDAAKEAARAGREAIRGRVRGERVHVRARDDGKRW
jgi:glutamate formiminotransferase